MQAGVARLGHGPPASPVLEQECNVVQLVLRDQVQDQLRVTVLLQDRGCGEHGFKAVGLPMADDPAEGPKRLASSLPVVGKATEEVLYLSRRAIGPDDAQLLGREGRERRGPARLGEVPLPCLVKGRGSRSVRSAHGRWSMDQETSPGSRSPSLAPSGDHLRTQP